MSNAIHVTGLSEHGMVYVPKGSVANGSSYFLILAGRLSLVITLNPPHVTLHVVEGIC